MKYQSTLVGGEGVRCIKQSVFLKTSKPIREIKIIFSNLSKKTRWKIFAENQGHKSILGFFMAWHDLKIIKKEN